nr:hypothetical protein [Tanacetum cinerariifolium]
MERVMVMNDYDVMGLMVLWEDLKSVSSSKPGLNSMTSGQISSGHDLTLFEAMYDDYISGQQSATARTVSPAQEPQVRQTSTASTTIADIAPTRTNSSSLATNIPSTSQDVDELNPNAMVDG